MNILDLPNNILLKLFLHLNIETRTIVLAFIMANVPTKVEQYSASITKHNIGYQIQVFELIHNIGSNQIPSY